MIELPQIPLQALPDVDSRVFVMREDLLPYGGGNKVRRLLAWFDDNQDAEAAHLFSDRGSHTFLTFCRIANAVPNRLERIYLYTRRGPLDAYREAIESDYLCDSRVQVVDGPIAKVGSAWIKQRLCGDPKHARLGVGGNTPQYSKCYSRPMLDCLQQLKQFNLEDRPVIHYLPVASGTMLTGFLEMIHDKQLRHHRIAGVATGPQLSKAYLSLKFMGNSSLAWRQKDGGNASPRVEFPLDPVHTGPTWNRLLSDLPRLPQDSLAIFWSTAPCV